VAELAVSACSDGSVLTQIIGWSAEPMTHRELVLNAALMAVRRGRPRGTIIHSDQGTQFGSDA
jgi:putative transposase